MMIKEIFDTDNTQYYLQFRLNSQGRRQRGIKSRFAKSIECDSAYVSRILEGTAQLSLEQGLRANLFFGHTSEESEFFLAQIGFSRAGSQELKKYYQKKLDTLREQHLTLSKRVKNIERLPEVTEANYYSWWLYAAVDIATSIPSLQSPDALSKHFGISLSVVTTTLAFLQDCGVVEQKEGRWINTNRSIYLSSDSPHIRKHHLNWRLKAMQLIEEPENKNLHYSSVISLSKKDFDTLKEHFIQTIAKAREIVKTSSDETIAVYNIDLFKL